MQVNIGYTASEIAARSWSNGDVILNLDSGKLQIRIGGVFIDNPSSPPSITMSSVSSNTNLLPNVNYLTNASSGNITHTLPTAVGIAGQIVYVKKTDSTLNTVTVQCTGGQTIDGDATAIFQFQNTLLGFQSTGTNWIII